MGKTLLTLTGLLGLAYAAREQDRVLSLPSAPPLLSKWYSGYFSVAKTRQLHYVFVESQNNVSTDPVMVWFAGGPGFSSMLPFQGRC